MPCPAPTGLSLRVRSQKRITSEAWQWRFPSGCFYFSWCRLQQACRASLTALAYLLTLREHCSTHSLLFSWSCLSWVLRSIDRADPLIPATLLAGVKASVAARGPSGPGSRCIVDAESSAFTRPVLPVSTRSSTISKPFPVPRLSPLGSTGLERRIERFDRR